LPSINAFKLTSDGYGPGCTKLSFWATAKRSCKLQTKVRFTSPAAAKSAPRSWALQDSQIAESVVTEHNPLQAATYLRMPGLNCSGNTAFTKLGSTRL